MLTYLSSGKFLPALPNVWKHTLGSDWSIGFAISHHSAPNHTDYDSVQYSGVVGYRAIIQSINLPWCRSSSSWITYFPNLIFPACDSKPTLHKPSMMAHFVRVLPGEKTIWMHYANCRYFDFIYSMLQCPFAYIMFNCLLSLFSTYNADFDGDEMNVHFPQDEISRSEAMNIVDANKQYIGPRSGDAVRGLIQV